MKHLLIQNKTKQNNQILQYHWQRNKGIQIVQGVRGNLQKNCIYHICEHKKKDCEKQQRQQNNIQ